MRLIRRICAAALVASVTLLGGCGSDTPATPDTQSPNLATNLDFSVSNGSPYFTAFDANQPSPRTKTVFIGGIIAAASYPALGLPIYSPAGNPNWLTVSTRPQFSRTPLGWNFDFTVDRTGLVDGLYTAQIPVTVTGARNNPQSITVTLAVCTTNNCLFLGDTRLTTLSVGQTFDWYDINYFHVGAPYVRSYFFEYRVFLRPGETMYAQNRSSSFGNGATLGDPTLTLYYADAPLFTGIMYNDDCSSLSSQIGPITNSGPTIQEYRLRAGAYSGSPTGTTNVFISTTSYCGGGGGELREAVPSDIQAIIDAKARVRN